jgi:hypothetical protein
MSLFNEVANRAVAVTPNDGADLPDGQCVGIWVGGAGTLTVDMPLLLNSQAAAGVATVLISGIAAGTLLPISVKRIRLTGTSATLITALYA